MEWGPCTLGSGPAIPVYSWQRVGDGFCLVAYNDAAVAFTDGAVARLLGAAASLRYGDASDVLGLLDRCYRGQRRLRREMLHRSRVAGGPATWLFPSASCRPIGC